MFCCCFPCVSCLLPVFFLLVFRESSESLPCRRASRRRPLSPRHHAPRGHGRTRRPPRKHGGNITPQRGRRLLLLLLLLQLARRGREDRASGAASAAGRLLLQHLHRRLRQGRPVRASAGAARGDALGRSRTRRRQVIVCDVEQRTTAVEELLWVEVERERERGNNWRVNLRGLFRARWSWA